MESQLGGQEQKRNQPGAVEMPQPGLQAEGLCLSSVVVTGRVELAKNRGQMRNHRQSRKRIGRRCVKPRRVWGQANGQ